MIHSLRSGSLAASTPRKLERGYYESLLVGRSVQLPALGGVHQEAGELARREGRGLKRFVGGFAQAS